ncbi:MAG: hypothetical protein ACI8W8_001453 [Rhodothermales bacterium]|jgi:hypothetical protein
MLGDEEMLTALAYAAYVRRISKNPIARKV